MSSEPEALPLNLHDYEHAARTRLSPVLFDFVAGGAGDERTLRDCREAFARWRLIPRVLRGLSTVSTATTVLGHAIDSPVLIAPTSFHTLFHVDGELATSRAARNAGTIYVMSSVASITIEEIAPECGPWWFQLYVFRDRAFTRALIDRAVAAGASALVLTVDTPVSGRREANLRHGEAPPSTMANLRALVPDSYSMAAATAPLTRVADLIDPSLSWADLDWLASRSPIPLVVKGILHFDDAVQALDHGAQGIIVSNHGGRQLDGAVASLDALPAVASAVAGRADVLLDGGIRRGTDVLTALALGARAVLVGRPIHWGLAVAGESGVAHVLDLLQTEIARDLMLCGLKSPADVDRALLIRAGTPL